MGEKWKKQQKKREGLQGKSGQSTRVGWRHGAGAHSWAEGFPRAQSRRQGRWRGEEGHGKGTRSKTEPDLGKALFIAFWLFCLGWPSDILQEQTHACSVPPLLTHCTDLQSTYKSRTNPGVRRSAPVPYILKRNLLVPPMKEWWLYFSDRMIPVGAEDHFCWQALSMFFSNLSSQYDSFHSSTWKNMLRVISSACTAKSITILIDQGSISCPNTDNKEVHTNSVPDLLSLEMTKQIYPGQPTIPTETQAPSARTGWGLNTASGNLS